jgi:hypothetical protein
MYFFLQISPFSVIMQSFIPCTSQYAQFSALLPIFPSYLLLHLLFTHSLPSFPFHLLLSHRFSLSLRTTFSPSHLALPTHFLCRLLFLASYPFLPFPPLFLILTSRVPFMTSLPIFSSLLHSLLPPFSSRHPLQACPLSPSLTYTQMTDPFLWECVPVLLSITRWLICLVPGPTPPPKPPDDRPPLSGCSVTYPADPTVSLPPPVLFDSGSVVECRLCSARWFGIIVSTHAYIGYRDMGEGRWELFFWSPYTCSFWASTFTFISCTL